MDKNIDKTLEEESLFLKEIQEQIGAEIEGKLRELSDLKQEIVDYRKFLFEEIPQKQHFMMDQDSPVREAHYTATYQRIGELSKMYYAPYFGLIRFRDPEEEDEEADAYYIGKHGLTRDSEPVILDWRTPAASLFYQQRVGILTYKAPSGPLTVDLLQRRQYVIKNGELKGMFDSDIDIKDDILQMVLSGSSGNRLKEIIATIQREQDDIIREPLENNIILNGVAGSGKTTIVLHRIAYLLYNYRSKLQDNVLIIGPNQIFMEYISDVLPDLGEREGTFQMTIKGLARELIRPKRPILKTRDYYERILSQRDEAFLQEIDRKSSLAFKKELDTWYKQLESRQLAVEPICFQEHELMSAEERNQLFTKQYAKLPYLRRCEKIKRLIRHRVIELRNKTVRSLDKAYRFQIAKAKKEADFYRANDLEFERLDVLRKYLKEVYRFFVWLRDLYTVPDLEEWYGEMVGKGPEDQWTEDDLCALLYLMCKLEGKGAYPIRHLVIDEAQDMSALGFLAVKQLKGMDTFTVVGDVRQKIKGATHHSMMDVWGKVLSSAEQKQARYYELHRSYRSTKEIMDYARGILGIQDQDQIQAIDRSGKPVDFWEVSREDSLVEKISEALRDMEQSGCERRAILCRTLEEAERIEGILRGQVEVSIIRQEEDAMCEGVVVLPVYFAKGLEFDGAVAVELKGAPENALLTYIMCTRALHQLAHIREVEAQ